MSPPLGVMQGLLLHVAISCLDHPQQRNTRNVWKVDPPRAAFILMNDTDIITHRFLLFSTLTNPLVSADGTQDLSSDEVQSLSCWAFLIFYGANPLLQRTGPSFLSDLLAFDYFFQTQAISLCVYKYTLNIGSFLVLQCVYKCVLV